MSNIKTVFFDLDDTLVETSRIFDKNILELNTQISKISNIPYEEISESFNKHLIDAYHKYAVNYNNYWLYTIQHILEDFKIDPSYEQELINIAFQIYKEIPAVTLGAIGSLENLKKSNIKLAMVTHASPEWTKFKVEGTKLGEYFDHIEIVDQNKFKQASDWKRALEQMNANPETSAIVGDNVKGDILAGYELGVHKLLWRKVENAWKIYREGELPSTVITIKDLRGIDKLLL